MTPAIARATALRVLAQLRHDRRTVAMMVMVPALLLVLLRYVFDRQQRFNQVAPMLLGLFPFVVMFLIASVGTLRERRSGTLERLMTTPMGKLDFLLGYALAFAAAALAQVAVVAAVAFTWLGLTVAGSVWLLVLVAVLSALLGTALGLAVSAFARSEFQAVQFLPVFVLPQALLCGLFAPRGEMARWLQIASDALPLTYAVDATQHVARSADVSADLVKDLGIIAGCILLALVLGAATLRRRTD